MTIFRHARRALLFLTGNVVAQGLAALSGLLLARWLAVSDYALYTIVFTVMGAMTVLTKGGVHLGFTAILGRTWPDPLRAAQVTAAMVKVRRLLSIFVLPPVVVVAGILLWRGKASPAQITLLVTALLAFWAADMKTRIVDQLLFFAHQTTRVQMLDATLAALRLAAIVGLYALRVLSLEEAVFIAVAVAVLRIAPIRLWIGHLMTLGPVAARDDDLQEMRLAVRRQIPVEIFYVFQAQLVLFVLSFFATSTQVAGYGALSRITQLLLPLQAFTYAFCVPIFSRATEHIGRRLLQMMALLSLPGLALVSVAALFPALLLWLVGPNYANLGAEVLVAAAVAALSSIASATWALIAHRGWVRWSWLQIPVGLIWCAVAPFVLDLGSITGAFVLQGGFSLGVMIAAAADYLQHRTRPLSDAGDRHE